MKIILFIVAVVIGVYIVGYLLVGPSPKVYDLEISRDEFIKRLNKIQEKYPHLKSKKQNRFGLHDNENYYFHINGLPGADYYAKVFSKGENKSRVHFQSYSDGMKHINGDIPFIHKKYKRQFRDSVINRIINYEYEDSLLNAGKL